MSAAEVALAKKWYVEDSESPREIARRLGRSKSTLTRLLIQRKARQRQGRKMALGNAAVDKLQKKLEDMIVKADGKYEVTAGMLKRSARCKACTRTILNRLHERGVYFRPLRQKPVLTPEDIEDRLAFAKKFGGKPATWWNNTLHLIIDVKHFQVLPHGAARKHAAQSAVRGTYRKKGHGLNKGHTKPVAKTKYNPGAVGVSVLAGVGHGKVLVWEYLPRVWGGEAAAAAYGGPVKRALDAEYPGRRTFTVLEDNDPTGFKSGLGLSAKKAAGIKAFEIPKRSPALNVCDYFLWSEVNRHMRKQEQTFPDDKRETRSAFLKRLRRTALGLPASVVAPAVGDMKRRCARLLAAGGGHIEEGGKSKS